MKHTFRDGENREWPLSVNVLTLAKIRERIGGDLISDDDLFRRYMADVITQAEVLADVIDLGPVTRNEFLASLKMEHILDGTLALLAAYADFYPEKQGQALRIALKQIQTKRQESERKLAEMLQSGEVERLVQDALTNVG